MVTTTAHITVIESVSAIGLLNRSPAPSHLGFRAICTCGFVGHWDTEHVATLDADGHAWVDHQIKQGTLLPLTPVAIRCDNCGHKVSNKQADKYDALHLDWALCPTCEAKDL